MHCNIETGTCCDPIGGIAVAGRAAGVVQDTLRRKLGKSLIYDERGTPMHRRRIKTLKREEQQGRCTICREILPERGAVLDRFEAMKGYTLENTRLLCSECDQSSGGAQL